MGVRSGNPHGVQVEVSIRNPMRRDEADFLAASRRSRALHRHFADPPTTPEAFGEFLRRARGRNHESHLVLDADTRDLVGVVNLNEIVRGAFQSAYLGYYAFAPFERRGYMTAALRLVIARAFGELRLHRIEANVQPDNEASLALVEKLGFRREGFSPRYLKIRGRWRDHVRHALLREQRRR